MPERNKAIKEKNKRKRKESGKAYSEDWGAGYFDCQYANEEGCG